MKIKSLLVATAFTLLAFGTNANAATILDTGTPDNSSNRTVFADPSLAAQFLAQQFTLTTATLVTTIEAYIGGEAGASITMDLTTQIGVGATIGNILGSYSLATPGLAGLGGTFVGAAVNQNLPAGDYYLVFSGGAAGGFMPINAPSTIGNGFIVTDGGFPFTKVNTALPIASDFSSATSKLGIRINGSTASVPDGGTTALLGLLAFGGLGAARRFMR